MKSGLKPEEATYLIFDLGGVIIDIAPEDTVRQLTLLPHRRRNRLDLKALAMVSNALETGAISEADFRTELRQILHTHAADHLLDEAWNSMLKTIPPAKIALLRELSSSHTLYLLSNTNSIHMREVERKLKEVSGLNSFDDLFTKCYYSHKEKVKKPNPELFTRVIKENNLDAAKGIFLDDLEENLAGARQTGLSTILVTKPDSLFEIFSYEPQP
ncbi:HAD family hydrolase [Roseivirga sp. BDSF3-8]|uniref:HAD family hydrolase n=1 Tax=Roseivirga sp. BDSF3-8 TaxID=3241598 RepID=UPI0035318266